MIAMGWIVFFFVAFVIFAPWIESAGIAGLAMFFILAFGITFLAKVVLPIIRDTRGVDDAKKD